MAESKIARGYCGISFFLNRTSFSFSPVLRVFAALPLTINCALEQEMSVSAISNG